MALRALPSLKPGEPHPALVKAVTRVLRPLIRMLVANGITYPYLSELIKGLYVGVSVADFAIGDKPPTDSRVSLLSGVHRKDVRRLRGVDLQNGPPPEIVSPGTQIVARWLADPALQDDQGKPRPLPRFKRSDGAFSFETLVEQVTRGDLRARSVLDELERLGIVALLADDQIELRVEGFVPDASFEEKAYYFGRILTAHLETAGHNLAPDTKPFLDRAVFYDGLLDEDAAALARMSHALGVDALKAVNREAIKMKRRAKGRPNAGKRRICFGVFYHAASARDRHEDQ